MKVARYDDDEFYSTLLLIFSRIKNKPTPFLPPNNEDNNNKPEDNSTSDSNVSCPVCKLEFIQKEIEEHLKDHLKNPLSKDFICDRLKIKKVQ
ncbi:hypothetical protein C2G38_2237585 [Gigaspora rosea]|uniref:Uncharacterized protein n=1 Tax=Gigaspora rosea TaxID=44941 RepID=A0A397TPG5_9GLOM|nr:hypothetical protein C2G38_2237585 [Gigaspora rosea]